MEKKHWRRITTLMDTILQLEPAEQLRIIELECKDDEALKKEMLQFLASIPASESFWETMQHSSEVLVNELTSSGPETGNLPSSPPITQVGAYKILHSIATGGMGEVYLAERNDGHFQRTVAIKILRQELSSPNHIKRFSTELEILSTLEHPNIARLYDGGVIQDNRPYLVMEFVDGEPIHTHCESHHPTLAQKLKLFAQVCDGVEYAHQNLVVHRDLKPDNIFVGPDGVVKILDFGIAKIIDGELSQQMLEQTTAHLRLLSVKYAAPEQITMDRITTATDVYALGLLLYELTTGRSPFDLGNKRLTEAEHIIRHEEPVKPSQKAESAQLSKQLRGDLDSIILKALRKEPGSRYPTVEKLLKDIQRYQAHRPVLARVDSLSYRFSKFMKRRKAAVGVTMGLLLILGTFLAYHLSEVDKQKTIAQSGQEQAEFITTFMVDLFRSASPLAHQGDTLTVFNLLDSGREEITKLNEGSSAKADLLLAFAHSYSNLGDYEEAELLYQQAYDIIYATKGRSAELANVATHMGHMYKSSRSFNKSAASYKLALELYETAPGNTMARQAAILNSFADVMAETGNADQAVSYLEQSLGLSRRANASEREILSIHHMLAKAYRHNKQYEKSETYYLEILNYLQLPEDHLTLLASIYNNLAYLIKVQGRTQEAIAYYLKSHETTVAIYGNDHPHSLMVQNNLVAAYMDVEEYEKALDLRNQHLQLTIDRYGEDHWRTASSYNSSGIIYWEQSRYAEAEAMYETAVRIYGESIGKDHTWTALAGLKLSFCKLQNGAVNEGNQIFEKYYSILKENREGFRYQEEQMLKHVINDMKPDGGAILLNKIFLLEALI